MSLRPWLTGFRARLNHQRSRRLTGNRSSRTEQLEQRTLLTATALVIGTDLTVLTDAAEDVTVQANATTGNAEVLIDGTVLSAGSTVPASLLTGLTIVTGSGDNVVDLSAVTAGVFTSLTSIDVDSGDGDDVIIGTTDLVSTLAGGDGNDSITGGSGAEVMLGGDGQDVIDGGVVARERVVSARPPAVDHGERVVRLDAHVCVHGEEEVGRVVRPEVQQRHHEALQGVVERKDDLPVADRAQVRRGLAVKVPVVHEEGAVREGEPLLPQRVVPVAPVVVLAVKELRHVRDRLAGGRLAPRRVGRRERDAAEGEEAGELLLARLRHRHVERLAVAGRVGPRKHARQAALGRVKAGEEEACDQVREKHGEVDEHSGDEDGEHEGEQRVVSDGDVGHGEAQGLRGAGASKERQLSDTHDKGLVHALAREAPADEVALRSHLGVGPEIEGGESVVEVPDVKDGGEHVKGARRRGEEEAR